MMTRNNKRLNTFYPMVWLVVLASGGLALAQPAAPPAKEQNVRSVAILISDGVELMDFAGPAEVFIVTHQGKAFRVFTVAQKADPVKTMGGLTIKPEFTIESAPKADILVIPGGDMRNVAPAGRAWIKKAAGEAQVVLSVCMGAFLLADAGLLDGIEATTHHWGIINLQKSAPRCKVVEGRRFVDGGKVVTTAGVTAGIYGALHIVERLLGKEAATWTAREWMEHPRPQ